MSTELIVGLIGGACTIAAPIITISIENWLRAKKYATMDPSDIAIVRGKWTGTFEQDILGNHFIINITLHLKVLTSGQIKGNACFYYQDIKYQFRVKGGFYLDKFLKMSYYNKNRKVKQFGTFVFHVDYSAKRLTGHFVGYSPANRKVISGAACFLKGE